MNTAHAAQPAQITAFIYWRRTGKTRIIRAPRKTSASKIETSKFGRNNLPELLDCLDGCFDDLRLPTDKELTRLDKKTRKALKRIGVFVSFATEIKLSVAIPTDVPLPAIACMNFYTEAERNKRNEELKKDGFENHYFHSYAYVIKSKSLPPYVAQLHGDHYQFGYAIPCTKNEKEGYKPTNLAWVGCWITVLHGSREIVIHDELRSVKRKIPCSRPSDRRVFGAHRTVSAMEWTIPVIIDKDEVHPEITTEGRRRYAKATFARLLTEWEDRNKSWLVSTKRIADDARVTFIVPPSETKIFFKNRDKTVKASDGKAKRIIHICASHTRTMNGKNVFIREHIRGIRKFNWGGFDCTITAPVFHVDRLPSSSFVAPSYDEYDQVAGEEMIDADDVGSYIEDAETF